MSRTKFAILIGVLAFNFAVLAALTLAIVMKRQRPERDAISVQLGSVNSENGIRLNESPKDAVAEVAQVGGSDCRVTRRSKPGPCYMYFSIDPSFKRSELMTALITVEYFDQMPGEFRLNYDGMDLSKDKPSPYNSAEDKGQCFGSQQWRKAYFLATNARFQGSQHDGADFRIEPNHMPELHIRRVTIRRLD